MSPGGQFWMSLDIQLNDRPRPCARVRWRGPRQSEKPEQRADRLPQQGHSRLPTLMSFAVCSAYVLSNLCDAANSVVRAMHSTLEFGEHRGLAAITCRRRVPPKAEVVSSNLAGSAILSHAFRYLARAYFVLPALRGRGSTTEAVELMLSRHQAHYVVACSTPWRACDEIA